MIGVSGVFLLLFIFGAVPAAPLSLLILPVLFLILWITFRRNRQLESPGDALDWLAAPIPWLNLATLGLVPLLAGLFYWVYWLTGLKPAHQLGCLPGDHPRRVYSVFPQPLAHLARKPSAPLPDRLGVRLSSHK